MTKAMRLGWLVASLGLMALGCGSDDDADDAAQGPLEIIGEYTSNFGGDESIDEGEWSSLEIVGYDNADNRAVVFYPPDAAFSPDTYSVRVWTEPEVDSFHYCEVDFLLESAEEANASDATADADDLVTGCGGFEWTQLTKK